MFVCETESDPELHPETEAVDVGHELADALGETELVLHSVGEIDGETDMERDGDDVKEFVSVFETLAETESEGVCEAEYDM